MTDPGDIERDAERADRAFREKARAELAAADALLPGSADVATRGDELAHVMLLQGVPDAEDRAGGHALAGPAGDAITKALDALGLPTSRIGLCTRPGTGRADEPAAAARVRLAIEAVDPRVVVALDATAAADLAGAYGVDTLAPGIITRVGGRPVLALEDFGGSLHDEAAKRRAWRHLKALATLVPETHDGRP